MRLRRATPWPECVVTSAPDGVTAPSIIGAPGGGHAINLAAISAVLATDPGPPLVGARCGYSLAAEGEAFLEAALRAGCAALVAFFAARAARLAVAEVVARLRDAT